LIITIHDGRVEAYEVIADPERLNYTEISPL
jgi:hypothetical protein